MRSPTYTLLILEFTSACQTSKNIQFAARIFSTHPPSLSDKHNPREMALQVKGKTALVTGAGSGICLEFTKLLLSKGCNVVVADLALLPEAESIVTGKPGAEGATAVFIKTDVTDWRQLRAAFEFTIGKFKVLDIVCPGAGVFEPVNSSYSNPRSSKNPI
jgi:3-hydroxybutyrate dehydrogenase